LKPPALALTFAKAAAAAAAVPWPMGKVPVRLKEVTYSLSPCHQYIWRGIFHDFSYKTKKRFNDNWVSALWLLVPVFGSYGSVGVSLSLSLFLSCLIEQMEWRTSASKNVGLDAWNGLHYDQSISLGFVTPSPLSQSSNE